jgi:hypothetical protein
MQFHCFSLLFGQVVQSGVPNLPGRIPPEKTALTTDEEQDLLPTEKRFMSRSALE